MSFFTVPKRRAAIAAALCAALSASPVLAADAPEEGGSFERFQKRVERIAEEHGVPAPSGEEMGLAAPSGAKTADKSVEEAAGELAKAAKNASPIERIVDMGISKVRAVKGKDGTLMFIADMGHFVFTGSVYDLWQNKQLTTIEEISDAVSRMNLKSLNLRPETLNLARIGSGKDHVTVFVDPLCGWCHKLMEEVVADAELRAKYTFDFLVVPALGRSSHELSRRLFCSEKDPAKRFEALRGGRDGIEKLPAVQSCDEDGFQRTQMTSTFLGVEAVPFVIAPDGRFSRGKPADLRGFLEGNATDGGQPTVRTRR